MERLCKLDRRCQVLLGGAEAEGSLAQWLTAQNPGNDGAAPLHRGRRARGVGHDVDQPVGWKIERLANRQGFAECLPVDQQGKVDRELYGRACAESADMLDAS